MPPHRHQTTLLSSSSPPAAAAEATTTTASGTDNKEKEKKEKKSINLLRGWPAPSLLPAAAVRAAAHAALSDPAVAQPALLYGPDAGFAPLREQLACWLGRFYGNVAVAEAGAGAGAGAEYARNGVADPERVAVACLLQSFTDPGHTLAVWMVAPCYFLACPIFADAGFGGRLRAVPEDPEGIDLDFLARGLRRAEQERRDDDAASAKHRERARRWGEAPGADKKRYKDLGDGRKAYRHVIYCVPSFANPSGKTMSLRRRRELVRLAREHDALVICDDVYDMLQWPVQCKAEAPGAPPPAQRATTATLDSALLPRLADIDIALGRSKHDPPGRHFGHAVSNGSFSKLAGPGMRTGWTYSTRDFCYGVGQTGSTRSGGAPSQLAAAMAAEMLRAGVLDEHIRHVLRPAYAHRHGLLMDAVRRELLPLGLRVDEGSLCGRDDVFGGYFVWMTLPARSDDGRPWPSASALASRCNRDAALQIGHGDLFEVHGDKSAGLGRAVRLCFAWEDESDLVEGVERLGHVARQMLDEGPDGWGGEKGGDNLDSVK
ncbi:PLP-dependent transferase [Xylariaceae sp. FL0804]|nr:PLP-dependent transferase [Xylariaceae sp. FL0804]